MAQLNSNALTIVKDVKSHLEISDAALTAPVQLRLERMINAASSMIERFVKRKLTDQTVTDYLDGRSNNRLFTREWPITGGPADGNTKPEIQLNASSQFGGAPDTVDPDEYFVTDRDTTIIRVNSVWPKGDRNIKVVYTVGYGVTDTSDGDINNHTTTIKDDLAYACLELVHWLYKVNTNDRIGIKSMGKQDERTTFETLIPPHVALFLEPYARHEFDVGNTATRNQ